MKKLSFLSMALVAGLSVSAQSSFMVNEAPAKINTGAARIASDGIEPSVASRANIWTNGFETPSEWTLSRTASNASPHGWYISDSIYANTWRNWHVDDFTLGSGNIAFVNNGDPVTNNPAPIQGEPFELFHTNGISMTGYENKGFIVSFDIGGYRYYDHIETYVSGDGQNWTLVGDLSDVEPRTVSQGVDYLGNTRRVYPVSPSDYNNSSTVFLKFTWQGSAAGGITYGIMIDNVAFEELPENDLQMVKVWTDDFQNVPEMRQTPINLAASRTLMGIIKNNGGTTTNVYMEAIVSSTSGDVTLNNLDSAITLAPTEVDTFYVELDPTQWEVSAYDVEFIARAVGLDLAEDFTPGNNSLTKDFNITNNTLAPNQRAYGGSSLFGNYIDVDDDGIRDLTPVSFYNEFVLFEDMEVHAIATAFADASVGDTEIGAEVTWGIYTLTPDESTIDRQNPIVTGQNLVIVNDAPENAGLTADDINTTRTVKHFNTAEFDPITEEFNVVNVSANLTGDVLGTPYYAGINLPADAIAFIRINNDDNDDRTSLGYGDLGTAGVALYTMPAHNIIELYMDSAAVTSVNEVADRPAFYLAQNRPNPFNSGGTKITYQLNKNANNVVFEIFDVTGKQVMNQVFGNQASGQYNIVLDGSQYTTGLYYYSLTVNGQKLTRKMVVTE